MSGMEKDWKDEVVFSKGRYAKFHLPTKRWYLFDRDGNNVGSGRNIRAVEDIHKELK